MTATGIVGLAGQTDAGERNWGWPPPDIEPAMISQLAVDRSGRGPRHPPWRSAGRVIRAGRLVCGRVWP